VDQHFTGWRVQEQEVGGRVFEGMLSTTGKSCGEGVVEVLVSS
jgi:hypothetical protein